MNMVATERSEFQFHVFHGPTFQGIYFISFCLYFPSHPSSALSIYYGLLSLWASVCFFSVRCWFLYSFSVLSQIKPNHCVRDWNLVSCELINVDIDICTPVACWTGLELLLLSTVVESYFLLSKNCSVLGQSKTSSFCGTNIVSGHVISIVL